MTDATVGPVTGVPLEEARQIERIARLARLRDPGLPADVAVALAARASSYLQRTPAAEAAEIARWLLREHPETGATPAAVVAAATLETSGTSPG